MTVDEPVADILARLEGLTAEQVLADAATRYAGRIAFYTTLGVEDQVVTHMIAEGGLRIPVFTVDTGRLLPETHDLIERTSARYGVNIAVYSPNSADVELMVKRGGINLFRKRRVRARALLRGAQDEAAPARPGRPGRLGLHLARRTRRPQRPEGARGVGRQRRPRQDRPAGDVGRARACGTTSAPTTSPTIPCTTKVSRPSTVRRARSARDPADPHIRQARTHPRRSDDAAGDRAHAAGDRVPNCSQSSATPGPPPTCSRWPCAAFPAASPSPPRSASRTRC